VASQSNSKKSRLSEWLSSKQPVAIGEEEGKALLADLAPISESYLRGLLRKTGIPLDPLIEGVRQDSFQDLERTLLALAEKYVGGDREIARRARNTVILAKDHARWAMKRDSSKSEQKTEMVLWMLTWLENPELFSSWAILRKRSIGKE
jgi:hypothetical protein